MIVLNLYCEIWYWDDVNVGDVFFGFFMDFNWMMMVMQVYGL